MQPVSINFNWGNGSPAPGIATNYFSIRWNGSVKALTNETYTFYTRTDDGVRLWVNGQLLINDWRNHAATTDSATIALSANQTYSIKMEYYDHSGKAVAQLNWSTPTITKQVIPTAQLYSH
jgi:hypothetical protein